MNKHEGSLSVKNTDKKLQRERTAIFYITTSNLNKTYSQQFVPYS
jgi:hypothetical protein